MLANRYDVSKRNIAGSICIAFFLLLSGCGGGGGGDAAIKEVTTPPTTPPVQPPTGLVLSALAPTTYEWGKLTSGVAEYIDRSFTFDNIPVAFRNLDYLRTANDDKFIADPAAISFRANQAVTVFVAYDSSISALPTWLQTWSDSGLQIQSSAVTLDVYQKNFAAGTVNLGGNEMGGSMYSVAVMPQVSATPLAISGTPATSISEGMAYSFLPSTSGGSGSLTFSIQNRPSWASFDTDTGELSGTPTIGDVGTVSANITISATDGQTTRSLTAFSLTVLGTGTGMATLSWTAPMFNSDGSQLNDLAGYKIRYGTTVGNYPNVVLVPGGVTMGVVENLAPGDWNFVVIAYDLSGNESGYSNVASKTITTL